jgi:hypothetical protein
MASQQLYAVGNMSYSLPQHSTRLSLHHDQSDCFHTHMDGTQRSICIVTISLRLDRHLHRTSQGLKFAHAWTRTDMDGVDGFLSPWYSTQASAY